MPLLDRAGADGITLMLDGEGGDELFGLSPYLLADRLAHGRWLSAARLAAQFPGSARPAAARRVTRLLWRYGVKGAVPARAHQAVRRIRGADRYAPRWLLPTTRATWFGTELNAAWKTADGPRWWAALVDGVIFGPGPALVYEQSRRRAALSGLEACHPLVDVDVIELMLRIPPAWAFDRRASRPLLREVVAGALPDEVRLRRDKSSFDALFHRLLAGRELRVVRELLGSPAAEVGAYVDLSTVHRELLDPPASGLQTWAISVWRLLTAECWLRSQADPEFSTRWASRGPARAEDLRLIGPRLTAP
jgi:asparagine synthase (glutamine-hydrolysing)